MHRKKVNMHRNSDFELRAARIAKAIRSIRSRCGKTTAEFGQMLGTNQSMISRYEGAKSLPGYVTTAKLLALAEGDERQAIMEQIENLVGRSEAQKVFDSLPKGVDSVLLGEALRSGKPNLARFSSLANAIIACGQEVDSSLPGLLALWLESGANNRYTRDRFADAERFLHVAVEGQPDPRRAVGRTKFRVIAPVDFGDGVLHRNGQIVELDLATALQHSYALLSIEEEVSATVESAPPAPRVGRKKSA
jgi:transcriptional regulator with XRE-family HTH domain